HREFGIEPAPGKFAQDVEARFASQHKSQRHEVAIDSDIIAENPTPSREGQRQGRIECHDRFAIMSRGSAIWPAIAEQATVAGEAREMVASVAPKRPKSFRVPVLMEVSPGASGAILPAAQGPHPGGVS